MLAQYQVPIHSKNLIILVISISGENLIKEVRLE